MKVVVIGGTGLIGSEVVTKLAALGHQAIAASPRTGVDTLTGRGRGRGRCASGCRRVQLAIVRRRTRTAFLHHLDETSWRQNRWPAWGTTSHCPSWAPTVCPTANNRFFKSHTDDDGAAV